jgi:preprotein translocase subunit YajC
MPQTDSTMHRYRILCLLVMDVPAIVAAALFMERGSISAREGTLGVVLLFVVNFLLLWMMQGRQQKTDSRVPEKGNSDSLPRGLFPAVVFTLAGIAAVVGFVREPNIAHGVEVGIAVLLVGYLWYIVYSLNRMRKGQIQK